MTTFGASVGGNSKVSVKKLVILKKTFKFPPTVAPNVVIFAHIIAKISLYLKSTRLSSNGKVLAENELSEGDAPFSAHA